MRWKFMNCCDLLFCKGWWKTKQCRIWLLQQCRLSINYCSRWWTKIKLQRWFKLWSNTSVAIIYSFVGHCSARWRWGEGVQWTKPGMSHCLNHTWYLSLRIFRPGSLSANTNIKYMLWAFQCFSLSAIQMTIGSSLTISGKRVALWLWSSFPL